MSEITLRSLSKPAQTICRDYSIGDPTISPSRSAHGHASLSKARRSPSSRSIPFFNRLTTSLSNLKRSPVSYGLKNYRSLFSKSSHNVSSSKSTQSHELTESKVLCPQTTLLLIPKPELILHETIEPTLPATLKASKTVGKSQKVKVQPLQTLQLTPLSHLIEQSYQDIERLRQIRATQRSNCPEGISNSQGGLSLVCGIPPKDEEGKEVDFSKLENNMKRFENLYAQFLKHEGNEDSQNEEVHLVTVVSKHSQIIKGMSESPIWMTKTKVIACGN